ncbi:hypothetical protein MPLSOD_20046 [Mesorhizobium sp. SOD10]|nr:hypothetical protein MPLSOD_20046 [Mesorhizobium sp. SOD10]
MVRPNKPKQLSIGEVEQFMKAVEGLHIASSGHVSRPGATTTGPFRICMRRS